ncbi:MAG TPA: sensor domain-containing diguanylate cyclase, partial [Acidimicrobiales bacterium]|nr:sensor domain-containing diguanylate cyclase [Acidimicrobiales bacterium]
LRWARRRRLRFGGLRRRARHLEAELRDLTRQMASLQEVASHLVAAEDVRSALLDIEREAGRAVQAPAHVLAVRLASGGPPVIHHSGLAAGEVESVGSLLLDGDEPFDPSWLVVDVASSTRRYGRIAAISRGGQEFFAEERSLLATYAGLAAAALDAAAARETAALLLDLARSLADASGLDDVARRVARVLPEIVGSTTASVFVWDEEDEALRLRGVAGLPPELVDELRTFAVRHTDTPLLAEMLDGPGPRLYTHTADDPFIIAALAAFAMSGVVIVPILLRNRFIGILSVGWPASAPETLDPEIVARLSGVAGQAATALDNAAQFERARHQALHDALTGLPNRALLFDRVEQALARCGREAAPTALLMVDLDDFKRINDEFGHPTGDRVLQEVAARLSASARDTDTVARLGGDEFVIVCERATPEQAATVVRRIERALGSPVVVGDVEVTVAASVGVIEVDPVLSVAALLQAVDEAMYDTKRQRQRCRATIPEATAPLTAGG